MKKLLIALAVLVVLVVGAVVFALSNLNNYLAANRDKIAAELSKALARDVSFTSAEASFSGGIGARIEGFRIADDPAFAKEDFLTADDVRVSVRLLPLLSGRVEVANVLLDHPRVTLIRDERGTNVESIGKRDTPPAAPDASTTAGGATPAPGAEGASQDEPRAESLALLVSHLEIRDATFRWIDRTKDSPADVKIDHFDLVVSDFSLTDPFRIELAAALFGETRNLAFDGTIGPLGTTPDPDTLAIDARLTLGPLDVAAIRKALPGSVPPELDAPDTLMVKAALNGTPSSMNVSADFDETDARLGWGDAFRKPAGTPFGVALRAKLDRVEEKTSLAIERLAFRLAGLELAGKGTVVTGSPTRVDLQLDSNATSLQGWDALIPALAGNDVSGTLEIHLGVKGALGEKKPPAVTGTIKLASVNARRSGSPYEVEGLTTEITLRENGLTLPPTKFRLGRSPVEVEADVNDFTRPVARFALRSPDLQAASLAIADPTARTEERLKDLAIAGSLDTSGTHPKFDGTVRIASGSLRNIDFESLAVDMNLAEQVARLTKLEMSAFDGRYSGGGRYDMKEAGNPKFAFDSTIRDMIVEKILDSQAPRDRQPLEGKLDADLKLSGSGEGWERIQQTLVGDGRLDVRDGVLRDVNVAEGVLSGVTGVPGLSSLISQRLRDKYPSLFATGDTPFEKLGGTVDIGGGKVTTNDLAIAARDYAVRGEGWFAFDQTVDFKATFAASKKLSTDLIAEVKEAKYLATDDGRIEIPFKLAGKIPGAKPKPDQQIVARALQRAVKDEVVDKGLDKIFGKPKEGEAEKPEKELLRKGLEGLFGR